MALGHTENAKLTPMWELKIIQSGTLVRQTVFGWPEHDDEESQSFELQLQDNGNRLRIFNPTEDKIEVETRILLQSSDMESAIFLNPPKVGETLTQNWYGKQFSVKRLQ